jgi:pilus assembly protein CpaC
VSTTVRLREGQTIVLAGLYGSTMTTEVDRIPFLGELPVIGPALFNTTTADQGQNELLIIVTPELVRPMEPDEVPPLPGFEVTAPNDIELYAYAKTEGYPDQGIYQLSPYAWGPGYAQEVGYRPFNPAPAGNAFGGGRMMGGGGYQVASPGHMMQQQPTGLMPGPPPQQPMMAPGMQQPGMMPGATPMQPIPDQNMSMMGGNRGLIQQVGYQQPAPRRERFMSWLKRQPTSNPALRPTNTTSPSLQNGNDGRLGRGGTFQPQQNRSGQGRPQQYYQPGPYPR